MNNKKISDMLKSFDENQIRQINEFLNSSRGNKIKNKLDSADKEKLLREFEKIDPNTIKNKMKNLRSEDIIRIINNL